MRPEFDNYMRRFARSKGYRAAFAEQHALRLVRFQIRVLRKQRGWTREKLAEAMEQE